MTEIESRVKSIIAEQIDVDESDIENGARITSDLGLDSLDKVELIIEIEKEFNVVILDDETEKILTVADIIAYLEKKLKI